MERRYNLPYDVRQRACSDSIFMRREADGGCGRYADQIGILCGTPTAVCGTSHRRVQPAARSGGELPGLPRCASQTRSANVSTFENETASPIIRSRRATGVRPVSPCETGRRTPKSRKLTFCILAAILFVLSGCGRDRYDYDASGTFEAVEIVVSSEATGRLEWFTVREGDRLRAGQEVGLVDTVQLHLSRLQLAASRKAVGSRTLDVSRQIAATEQQIATQRRERERTQRLVAADAANTKQLDDIDAQIAVLERQLAAHRESLQSGNLSISGEAAGIEAQIASVEDRIARSRISSPIDGTVLVKYAEQGEFTSPGMPLFKVADTDRMILRAYVTSGQLSQLKIGQEVMVYVDSDGGSRQYAGRVSWIADQAEFTPKTIQTKDERANLVYAVKIDVENDGFLKIGMYGDVNFNFQ